MKHLLVALFTLASLTSLGKNKIRKEINYVRSFRDETDSFIVELGNNSKLCLLQRSNPNFTKYVALIKQYEQKDYFISRKLFEIEIEEETNNIKQLRSLDKREEELHKHLQPEMGIAVAAVSASQEPEKFYEDASKLFDEKRYEEAISIINKAIVINTQDPEYHKLKSLCFAFLKQYRQSTNEAKFALEMDKANPSLYEIIANNYYFLKDSENAIRYYEKAIEHEMKNEVRIYHNYVKCLIEVPNPQRAIAVYKLFQYRTNELTVNINDEGNFADDLAFYAGQAYQQLNELKTALNIYDRLIVMYPDVYGYCAQRGRLFQQKGDFLEAIRDYKIALQLDSTESILLTNLAQIYQELGDYKRAEEAYTKYFNQNPNDATQMGNYGYLLLDAERYKEAQIMFEKSFKTDDKSIDTQIGRILAAHLLGKTKKKKQYIAVTKLQFPETPINTATLNTLIKTANYYYSKKIITIWEDAIE